MTNLEKIIDDIIKVEGGYSNDAHDAGGETMYGITYTVAKANGYNGSMKELPLALARQIYKNDYWFIPQFDKIEVVSPAIAAELCDTGANAGIHFAKVSLQKALNLLGKQGADYPKLDEDGVIGSGTLRVLAQYMTKRGLEGDKTLVKLLNVLQAQHYIDICAIHPANYDFLYGWLTNRVSI